MSENNENTNSNTCIVCYKNVEIYSIGICQHPVCYECSTRMRVLCCQNECPICRQDLPKVVFTREIKPFQHLPKGNLQDTKYDIYFDTIDIQEKFYDLLADICTVCNEKKIFNNFQNLKDHMRHHHELHYCDLCVENLKIFSHERRCYTRAELAQHRRKGDVDDRSHKGHPLCEFCDQRYMDNDDLYRHLRRDHLYCHFCDADGLHQYYSSYEYLRDHFRQEHFLCEEGLCVEEKFTSVFRTDIDLKAHKTSIHGKQLSKAAAKQARTLELEFTLAPRGENRINRRRMSGPSTSKNIRDYNTKDHNFRDYQQTVASTSSNNFPTDTEPLFMRQRSVDVQSTEEFPTLGTCSSFVPNVGQSKTRGNVTIRSTVRPQSLAVTDENFPALGPEPNSCTSKTVNFSVSRGNTSGPNTPQCRISATSNVSIQVNHEINGTVTTRVSGPNIRIRPAQLSVDTEFPVLGCAKPPTSAGNSAQWKEVLQWTCSKSASTAASKSKKPLQAMTSSPPTIQSGEDFPSLSKSSRSNKQSAIMVAPPWVQSQSSNNSNNTKSTVEVIKSKTKKKKTKSGNNSNEPEVNSTRSNTAANDGKKVIQPANYLCDTTNMTTLFKNSTSIEDTNHCNDTSINANKNNSSNKNNISSNSVLNKNSTITPNENVQSLRDTSNLHNVRSTKNPKEMEHLNKKGKKKGKIVESDSSTIIVKTADAVHTGEGMQRKRTELKINSLNSTNNNVQQSDNRSVLDHNSSKPGSTNPPPGFESTTSPPPGFCIKVDDMDQLHGNNGLTFTNSSGESYTILPDDCKLDNNYAYVPPPDFQKRNKSLVAKVNETLVQQDKIEGFRYISGLFRQGMCTAENYYLHCCKIMGKLAVENIFPELLVLLPDILKQQELFKVYKKEIGKKVKDFELCNVCNQILKNGCDFQTHMASHTLENHFPALTKNNSEHNKHIWVRK